MPIDGIGLEMHLGTGGNYPTSAQADGVMRSYGDLGLQVQITELDVGTSPTRPGHDPAAEQRDVYDSVAEDCQRNVDCELVDVWGFADPYSWRGGTEHPLLIDDAFTPEPAYADVRQLLADPAHS